MRGDSRKKKPSSTGTAVLLGIVSGVVANLICDLLRLIWSLLFDG